MSRERSTPEQRARYKASLNNALKAGYAVLKDGGEAMDAAVAAVASMEDNVLFNAGKGAVFNVAGKNELETSIMLSKPPASNPDIPTSRRGFGLTLLTHVRNPSKLARALYLAPTAAPHTFLSGQSVDSSQKSSGSSSSTRATSSPRRVGGNIAGVSDLPEEPLPFPSNGKDGSLTPLDLMPTAVTSTGGRTNKLAGRIGDTPSMGSGFWAEEWPASGPIRRAWDRIRGRKSVDAVGVSGTGDGDYFIRLNTASTIGRRVRYEKVSLEKAARDAVKTFARTAALASTPLNSSGMYRGVIREDGVPKTAIFDDEELD
ncbi:nucleophile aminohydrolase [Irpex lacteus]|nr:nucleophile aminohydrolase [Irpex lacteus]